MVTPVCWLYDSMHQNNYTRYFLKMSIVSAVQITLKRYSLPFLTTMYRVPPVLIR